MGRFPRLITAFVTLVQQLLLRVVVVLLLRVNIQHPYLVHRGSVSQSLRNSGSRLFISNLTDEQAAPAISQKLRDAATGGEVRVLYVYQKEDNNNTEESSDDGDKGGDEPGKTLHPSTRKSPNDKAPSGSSGDGSGALGSAGDRSGASDSAGGRANCLSY